MFIKLAHTYRGTYTGCSWKQKKQKMERKNVSKNEMREIYTAAGAMATDKHIHHGAIHIHSGLTYLERWKKREKGTK